jgi:hypothetical protein
MYVPMFVFFFLLAGVVTAAHPEPVAWLVAFVVAFKMSR